MKTGGAPYQLLSLPFRGILVGGNTLRFSPDVQLCFSGSQIVGQQLKLGSLYTFQKNLAPVKYPELNKLENEYFIKFVTGEVNLDKGFDDFVSTLEKDPEGRK